MLDYPFDWSQILAKKRAIKRELLAREDMTDLRIAILGGSTTSEIKNILEIFLLKGGIKPAFYESSYNRYYEDVIFDNPELLQFAPQIIYIHTTNVNVLEYPIMTDTESIVANKMESEFTRYKEIWEKIRETYNCVVIQNNFELPELRYLGNIESSDIHGKAFFLAKLNNMMAEYSAVNRYLLINDINYLSSWIGLSRWYDRKIWYSYKYAFSFEAIPLVCHNISRIIFAVLGKSKKCIVLDLDNTVGGDRRR
jgi:predicted enzyme involved in methoxymalonyl-ACP biosynthesis